MQLQATLPRGCCPRAAVRSRGLPLAPAAPAPSPQSAPETCPAARARRGLGSRRCARETPPQPAAQRRARGCRGRAKARASAQAPQRHQQHQQGETQQPRRSRERQLQMRVQQLGSMRQGRSHRGGQLKRSHRGGQLKHGRQVKRRQLSRAPEPQQGERMPGTTARHWQRAPVRLAAQLQAHLRTARGSLRRRHLRQLRAASVQQPTQSCLEQGPKARPTQAAGQARLGGETGPARSGLPSLRREWMEPQRSSTCRLHHSSSSQLRNCHIQHRALTRASHPWKHAGCQVRIFAANPRTPPPSALAEQPMQLSLTDIWRGRPPAAALWLLDVEHEKTPAVHEYLTAQE